MSETPERIEREMFEIRSRMAPDVTDLRKHLEPKYVGEQVKTTARERLKKFAERTKERLLEQGMQAASSAGDQISQLREPAERAKTTLLEQGRQTADAASQQLSLISVAMQKRDPSQFTAAVKEDPRPAAVAGAVILLILLTPRR